jgi:hypothetical protein
MIITLSRPRKGEGDYAWGLDNPRLFLWCRSTGSAHPTHSSLEGSGPSARFPRFVPVRLARPSLFRREIILSRIPPGVKSGGRISSTPPWTIVWSCWPSCCPRPIAERSTRMMGPVSNVGWLRRPLSRPIQSAMPLGARGSTCTCGVSRSPLLVQRSPHAAWQKGTTRLGHPNASRCRFVGD